LAWLDLIFFNEAPERARWNKYPSTNPDVLNLTGVDELTNLPLRQAHAFRELPWCFYALVHV